MNNQVKELQERINNLMEDLNDTQKDFINNYNLLDVNYVDDAIREYADSNVNVYYKGQREYFNKDTLRATQAFKEFGYTLDEFDDLDDAICKAGVCAEYLDIVEELEEKNRLEELQKLLEEREELKEEE